ncbi:secreted RxLR effector protein 161-like [Henckelia pumila]|uniref:secreted RxLR effector protein 161-like n=1 Tax=Henckelia pumila TaxID=405737 RepID=UPI003C6E1527
MVCSRPDLAYAISVVSRFMENSGTYHWEALKWILRYLINTTELGLKFEKQQDGIDPVVGYVDSDFAGILDTRNSLTGYVFTFYGTTITWKSNLQSVVALSTTEAEFIAVTEAIKEGLWLKGMIAELGVKQDQVIIASKENPADAMTKSLPYAKFKKCLDLVNAVIGN